MNEETKFCPNCAAKYEVVDQKVEAWILEDKE